MHRSAQFRSSSPVHQAAAPAWCLVMLAALWVALMVRMSIQLEPLEHRPMGRVLLRL